VIEQKKRNRPMVNAYQCMSPFQISILTNLLHIKFPIARFTAQTAAIIALMHTITQVEVVNLVKAVRAVKTHTNEPTNAKDWKAAVINVVVLDLACFMPQSC